MQTCRFTPAEIQPHTRPSAQRKRCKQGSRVMFRTRMSHRCTGDLRRLSSRCATSGSTAFALHVQRQHRLRCPPRRVADAGLRPVQPVAPAQTPPVSVQEGQHHGQHASTHHLSLNDHQQQLQQHHNPSATATATVTPPIASQAETHAQALFDYGSSHIPSWSPLLALYFPFGLLLATFRMSLWIGGVLLDAPWFRNPQVVRTYLSLLGFKATWHNLHLLPKGHHVMVSNHVTPGDLMVLFDGLPHRYTHLITTALPPRVTETRNLPCTLRFATPEVLEQLASSSSSNSGGSSSRTMASTTASSADKGRLTHDDAGSAQARAQAAASVSQQGEQQQQEPVHLFPEGGVTHGRWGMMQFQRGFTRLVSEGDLVVPVALKVRTPWGIRTHTLLSSFPENLFWMSFCPWIRMDATVLPPVQLQPGEAKGAFAKRVQQTIAEELGQVASECNITVKKRIMQQQAKLKTKK